MASSKTSPHAREHARSLTRLSSPRAATHSKEDQQRVSTIEDRRNESRDFAPKTGDLRACP
ncbi:MAG TPA: hypothetical protein PKV33_06810 [Methanothrix sp.]|nr:hypothetical protein [Methanothrix sp.]